MTMRWLGLSLTVLLLSARVVSAAVTTTPTSPINVGPVVIGAVGGGSAMFNLQNASGERVDLAIGTCTGTGAGTFVLSDTTNINAPRDITVTYTPTARGTRTCTVNATVNGAATSLGSFQVTASGIAPVVDVRVTGVSVTMRDFGPARVTDTSATPSVSVAFTVVNTTNDTGQTLSVSGISFSGTNPADFSVASGPAFGQPIAINGGNASWTIMFNPAALGPRSAIMTVATNDPITPMRNVTVTGSGTTGTIAITDVAFGTVGAGATSTLSSALSNTATADIGTLTATSAQLDQTSTWFSFGTGLGCTAGTTSCTFVGATAPAAKNIPVRCHPPAAASGTQMATLTVFSDSDGPGDNTATLTCTAGRSNIQVDKTSIDFGNQFVNTTGSSTVMVSNDGNTNLTFWFQRSTGDTTQFSASTMTGCGVSSLNLCTVLPGQNMVINVGFTPTSAGNKATNLLINNNDPDAGDTPRVVALAGVGIAPIATPDPVSLAFGNVEVGKTGGPTTLTVTNTGTANLTITNAAITLGAGEFAVTMGTTGLQTTVIAPNASATWQLTCTPTSQGGKTGTFTVTSNSGGTAGTALPVGLSCTGQRGNLALNVASHNFLGVREGDTRMQTFTLSNNGNVAVNAIAYTLDPKLLGFSVSNVPTSLPAGGSQVITVTFSPANANEGCAVVNSGDCVITFMGNWGSTPTPTSVGLLILGDGLNATYDTTPAAPNTLDFGEVRFDETKPMQVQVINTGGSAIKLEQLVITMGGTSVAGELVVSSCQRGNTFVACPLSSMATDDLPTSGVNDTITLNITCDPANRVGLIEGTLTVYSDLNTAMPDRTVPLKCTSTTAGMAVTPSNMVLDFGPTDLDVTPVSVTRKITVTNTGTARLNLGTGTPGGANLARFAFTTIGAQVIQPGASFDVDVTYTPLAEKPPNAPDVASLTFPLAGVHMGAGSLTINISGFGADRHIGVGAAPTFPDTFKNPGDNAPVMPVTISNTGHAPLSISAVMLDNDPIWSIANPDPVTIPATSSHDFNVRFAPLMAGKAPTGHLVIMNNDNGNAMVQVDLNGNGRDRSVSMGPRVILLGFTGIGIPIRLSELAPDEPLVVENADTENSFRIANIAVDSIVGAEGTFEIVDLEGNEPTDLMLDPGGTQAFDITFTPTEVGDFEAVATLYLDMDSSPQAQVTLRGRGLYVDARGGGGCSTSGGSRGWLALVLAAIMLGGQRRRTRRVAVAAAGLVAAFGAPQTSEAQVSRNLNLNVFEPTPATMGTTFQLQNADVGNSGDWVASALLTYANNALVLDTSQNDDAAVKNRTMLLLGGAYAFGGRFEAGARVPLLMQSGDPAGDPSERFGVAPAEGASLGDATIHVKAYLGAAEALGGDLAYGFGGAVTVPTATGDGFAGNELPTARVLFLSSLTTGRVTANINVGGVLRETVRFANINQKSGALWGAGLSVRLLNQLWLGGEVFGDLVPGGKLGVPPPGESMGEAQVLNTIEGVGGIHYRPARTMALGVGIGRGVTSGPGTPAVRGILTFTYAPGTDELKPLPVKPMAPPKDTDLDGIVDAKDDCPTEGEDKDNWDDVDGCPEPDNDSDGLADASDKCPLDAEDKDRFQDEDGCPDKDNDNDSIADAKDKCPLAAEDKDAFQDQDGCPELDNDGDGIADNFDKCPKEAEIINGNNDDDGCADKGNSLVVLSPDRIELLESIAFNREAKIAKSSSNVLGQLAATLRAHPEIVRLRLTAHVQPTRSAKADERLSEARAKAVREWLVDWGIEPLRLQSSGFGGAKPLVDPKTRGAEQINDRVELIILERK